MQVTLWDDAAANTSANQKCTTPTHNVTPDAQGRFQVILDQACFDAVKANPNLWVQVQVGATVLPRSKLGAVPFAVESGKASRVVINGDGGVRTTTDGVFCGATANTNGQYTAQGGARTGYRAAKFLCEQTCGSSTAHMCSGLEAVRSHSLGFSQPIGWLLSASEVTYDVYVVDDCVGFTVAGGNHAGLVWNTSPVAQVAAAGCSSSRPILCCD